ncbi:hypothetical protein GA0115239_10433 [Streptomyces sp. BpilaLS-43]|nr:hypothetical protein GA0115239_10433 [Streptomyces sp. BpilaLS-43]
MDVGEAGQGTPFDSMSHEDMLAWLDKANSGAVKGASDRLLSAATEIKKVATELKDRPQRVSWEGEGAKAFRTWSADLANATLRLGDFSSGVSEWLAEASNAIATAQASVPRTHAGAQANLDAARIARNDPDASTVAREAAETLIATQESNRQEAADQMRRLAQAYAFSAKKMDALERPVFPPPPGAIVPPDDEHLNGGIDRSFGSSDAVEGVTGYAAKRADGGAGVSETTAAFTPTAHAPSGAAASTMSRPVNTEIAGAVMLPDAPNAPTVPHAVPGGVKGDGMPPLVASPAVGGSVMLPKSNATGNRSLPGVRPPASSTGGPNTGSNPVGRPARDGGITGGRQVTQPTGRPLSGLPRGNVIGGETSHTGRPPMSHGPTVGGSGGQSGIVGGRRLASEAGGLVGGRPAQQGQASGRPFTPGGTGLVRGGGAAEGSRGTSGVGRGAGVNAQRRRETRGESSERPDYLLEDEETWQQGSRRVVPPVID